MSIESNNVSVGGLMILIKGNKILLLKRSKNSNWEPGSFTLPSGSKENKETIMQTAIRETQEEIGVIISPENTQLVHTLSRKKPTGEEWVDCFFAATDWNGEPKIMEVEKCDSIKWFDLNNLPENIISFVKQGIENYLKGIKYSEFGYTEN